jgi:hypothetical protein
MDARVTRSAAAKNPTYIDRLSSQLDGNLPFLYLHELMLQLQKKPNQSKTEVLHTVIQFENEKKIAPLSNVLLAKGIGCSKSYVTQIRKGTLQIAGRKRSMTFSFAEDSKILTEVLKQLKDGTLLTEPDLCWIAFTILGIRPQRGWARSFFKRHKDVLGKATAEKREYGRMEIKKEDVTRYKKSLADDIEGVSSLLIFNCDEVGVSLYCDERRRRVIVAKEDDGETLHVPVDRGEKHLSMMACVSLAGEALMPHFLTKGVVPAVELQKTGLLENVHATFAHTTSGYMTKESFKGWVDLNFVPQVNWMRKKLSLEKEKAMLLLDNCPSHLSDESFKTLGDANITFFTLLPNATHLLQPCDVGLFGAFKQHLKNEKGFSAAISPTELILHCTNAFRKATTTSSIIKSFRRAGSKIIVKNPFNFAALDETEFTRIFATIEKDRKAMKYDRKLAKRRQRPKKFGSMNDKFLLCKREKEAT